MGVSVIGGDPQHLDFEDEFGHMLQLEIMLELVRVLRFTDLFTKMALH